MDHKLIYADEFEKELIEKGLYPALVKSALKKMKPADAVEAVRCEDCINYNGHRYCYYLAMPVMDNDFCSYGKRRTDNE